MGIKYHEDGKIKYILDNNINGKGKEYDGGLLSFKGEYLNGKRNGKGKEYWGSVLIFEGEYLNGYKNGKGKKYYENSVLEFEGEYKNDKKWSGKGYDPMNNIIYEVRNGKGLIKEYYYYMPKDAKLQFEGEYLYGEKNGKGREYYDNGNIQFECEYINGQRNGKGKEYYENGKLRYEGEYLYNYRIQGKLYINEKMEYEGEFLYDKKWNGKGFDEYGNIIYELKNGNGKVKEYYYNGKLEFEGKCLNGKRTRKGKRI